MTGPERSTPKRIAPRRRQPMAASETILADAPLLMRLPDLSVSGQSVHDHGRAAEVAPPAEQVNSYEESAQYVETIVQAEAAVPTGASEPSTADGDRDATRLEAERSRRRQSSERRQQRESRREPVVEEGGLASKILTGGIVTIVVLVAAVALLRDNNSAPTPTRLTETDGFVEPTAQPTAPPAIAEHPNWHHQTGAWTESEPSATQPATYIEEQQPALLGAPQAVGETPRQISVDRYSTVPANATEIRQAQDASENSSLIQRF